MKATLVCLALGLLVASVQTVPLLHDVSGYNPTLEEKRGSQQVLFLFQ